MEQKAKKEVLSNILKRCDIEVGNRDDVALFFDDYPEILEYVSIIESERNELKLKEQIAHDAKETAQDLYQIAQKTIQKLESKQDELKGMVLEADKGFVKLDKKMIEDQKMALEVNDKLHKELQALKDDIEIKLSQLEIKGSKTFWSQEYFELEKFLKELIK